VDERTSGDTECQMPIEWNRDDVDAALAEAKNTGRPVLIDFTAAPA
jgi:thiol:disulfide interchange protein